MTRRRGEWSVLILAIGVGACGAESSEGAAGRGGPPPGMPVEVSVATVQTVVEAISATGQIEAVQSIALGPEVEGRIVEILAREGTEVQRGTPLFKVDDAELKAEVARLQAQRDLAAQALQRTQALIEQRATSPAQLDEAEANARTTQAELDLLQVRLERTVVRAPFSGVVGERLVSVGDYVSRATPLTTLQTVNPQRASFQVPERYAGALDVGQTVTFRVAAVEARTFSGVVEFVDPIVSLPSRTITVKARVPNPDRYLKPGMFIEASLAIEERPDAVVVPEDAILPLSGADYVWVVSGGQATRIQVDLGVRTPGFVELRTGVAAGDTVVVGGLERLAEGAPVMPIPVERGGDVPTP
ncbi:MAG: efflux RND transporter periplasmic adaptor subunit [Gemmatimonadota bacterium]|nr:MAG: efflux RND transporter periplasmic adaptor subunit [Gemmatimonadota bacterium]